MLRAAVPGGAALPRPPPACPEAWPSGGTRRGQATPDSVPLYRPAEPYRAAAPCSATAPYRAAAPRRVASAAPRLLLARVRASRRVTSRRVTLRCTASRRVAPRHGRDEASNASAAASRDLARCNPPTTAIAAPTPSGQPCLSSAVASASHAAASPITVRAPCSPSCAQPSASRATTLSRASLPSLRQRPPGCASQRPKAPAATRPSPTAPHKPVASATTRLRPLLPRSAGNHPAAPHDASQRQQPHGCAPQRLTAPAATQLRLSCSVPFWTCSVLPTPERGGGDGPRASPPPPATRWLSSVTRTPSSHAPTTLTMPSISD